MAITLYFSDKRVLFCFVLLLNRIIVVFFFFFPLSAHHQQKGRTIRTVQQRNWTCLFWKHSGRCGGWPPVEEALEGILTLREIKMSDLQGPFQPSNSKILRRVRPTFMPWESLNFMNCFGERAFLPFCLNPEFCLKSQTANT